MCWYCFESVQNGQAVFRVKEALHYQDILEFRLEDDTKAYEYTVKNEAAPGDVVTCNVKRGSTIFKGQKVYRTKNAALLSWIDEKIESVDDKISLKGRNDRRKSANRLL